MTQIVAEVPESLETSQKRDRKKSYFAATESQLQVRSSGVSQLRDSTTEGNNLSRGNVGNNNSASARDSGVSIKLRMQQPFNFEQSLESPIGRKVGQISQQSIDPRTSSIELFGVAAIASDSNM